MKKLENIRSILGITQENLALLLEVTRSQLSLYEIGKRNILIAAKKQLTEMLAYMQDENSKLTTISNLMKTQELARTNTLKQMLQDNHYKKLLLEKKIKILEEKQAFNFNTIHLMRYLDNTKNPNNQFIKAIETKGLTELENNSLALLTKYEIEKEVLQAEEKILNQFLNKKS